MALSFSNRRARTRDQMIAIDLGKRTTKAVHVQRKGENFILNRWAVLDAPVYANGSSVGLMSEHLGNVREALGIKSRAVSLAVGVGDSIVRHAELPRMKLEDLRSVLKNNAKLYLQQDLPDHVFDCSLMQNRPATHAAEEAKAGAVPKQKALVGGARRELVHDLETAVKNAGLTADYIVPALVCPANALERAESELFQRDVIALVDIGFSYSSICLLQQGYAEAEDIKLGMATEIQDQLHAVVSPLARELRASIDFFEHQQDRPVAQVFLSGGSARSEFILGTLQAELAAECRTWNPTNFMQYALPPEQVAQVEQAAPQLGVAVGAALATL